MRILFLNHNTIGYGTYYRCLFLGKYLVRLGHEVTLICASDRDFDLRISVSGICKGMRIVTLPRFRYHKYYTGQAFRTLLGSLYSFVSRYDIIHCFAVAQPPTGIPALVSSVRGKPVVCDWDDLWGGGFAEYHNFAIRKGLETFERMIPLMAADGLTVVSDLLLDRAKAIGMGDEDVYKIPNGANVDEIRPMDKRYAKRKLGLNVDDPLIVSVGHTYLRGLLLLFRAFSLVVNEIRNARLLMVGERGLPREVESFHEKMADNVILAGEQPYKLIPYYLGAADVLVLPMEDSTIEKARWPIRLGDYLASGRPIVSNAVGEVKKVLEEDQCGIIASVNDVDKFSEEILKLLTNECLQEKLGERARSVAEEKYSWARIAERLSNIYELAS